MATGTAARALRPSGTGTPPWAGIAVRRLGTAFIVSHGLVQRATDGAPGSLEDAIAVRPDRVAFELRRSTDGDLVLVRSAGLRSAASPAAPAAPAPGGLEVEHLAIGDALQVEIRTRAGARFSTAHVVPLAAGLRRLGNGTGAVLDLPVGPRNTDLDRALIGHLAIVPEARRRGPRVVVRSRDTDALLRIRAALPGVITLARLGASAARYSLPLVPPGVHGVTVPVAQLDGEVVTLARERGLAVTVDQVPTPAEARRAVALGADAVESDGGLLGEVLGGHPPRGRFRRR
jgi:hypothetical protein